MDKPRIHLDGASLGAAENLRGPLEAQLTSALDLAVDKVDKHYHGETVDEVAVELLEETKAALHSDIAAAVSPNEDQLHSVAESIVADQQPSLTVSQSAPAKTREPRSRCLATGALCF